jgi:hypothetical protein
LPVLFAKPTGAFTYGFVLLALFALACLLLIRPKLGRPLPRTA